MAKPTASEAERRHARPGRRELPVQQRAEDLADRAVLARQRPGEPLEHALSRFVLALDRAGPAPQRAFQERVELVVGHCPSPSIISARARRRFCLPRTSKVSTAETVVSSISATWALLMPSV